MKKVKSLTLTPLMPLMWLILAIQLYALPVYDTFISPVNTTLGELKLKNNSEINGTDASGNVYTTNLSENNGKCYDTDGNEVTCQEKGEDAKVLYFRIYQGDGSDGDKEISSDLTIDSSNIDDYDNVEKFEVDDGVALTLDSVTIHASDDFIFDDDAKDLTIKGNVVIYAKEFDLGDNVGINIKDDASLKIFLLNDANFGEKSFVNTNGYENHFLVFAEHNLSIKDNEENDQGDFDGFFYAVYDLYVGKQSVVNGAVTGGHRTEVKGGAKINFDSTAIENTDVSELTENYCSTLFGGSVSTIDGGELKIDNNAELKNTPSDGSLYTDIITDNNGKCYDTDGNEVICKENGITALIQSFSIDQGDGSDGDKEISSDLTIDSSNIDDYDNVEKFEVDDGVALTLDSVTIHASDDFIFDDDAKDLTIKGNVVIYAKEFDLGDNVGINIKDDASLKIIASDNVKIGKKSFIDTDGYPEHFVLFTRKKIDFKDYKGNKSFDGFFYADDDFNVGKDVIIKGAVVGKKVEIKDNAEIEYDSNAANNIINTGVCVDGNESSEDKNYKFDAWDTFRDITDRNISTKIVNQEFNLTIASLDKNKTSYQEFNGTVCAKVDNNITKLDFRDQNTTIALFKISRAIKDIKVHLFWKKNIDESCPLNNENNETNSTDNFAIRPEKFTISTVDTLRAGNVFDFNVSADALDYNTTVNIDANLTKDCSAKHADFNITTISFLDGDSNNTVKFADVGIVDINITDKNWASVDDDDTPQNCDANGTYICLNKTNITIIPDHFEINSTMSDFYDTNFTYFSNDLNMSAKLDINVTAKNDQNQTTKNYNTACYAKDIDINISTNTRVDLPAMFYIYKDASDFNSTLQSGNINIIYTDGNFTTDSNGSSKIRLYINYDRDRSKKLNPFDLDIVDINVTDENATFGKTTTDKNATFYYGRVKTRDITTNKQTISNSLHVEVYKLGKYHQESLNWYINGDDNSIKIDILIPQEGFVYKTDTNKSGIILDKNSSLTLSKGIANFTIKNSWDKSDNSYIHVEIPPYLWYSSYQDYNFSDGSDCSSHPCFQYIYNKDGIQKGIQSGDFNGSNIGYEYNATKTKKGIKVFR